MKQDRTLVVRLCLALFLVGLLLPRFINIEPHGLVLIGVVLVALGYVKRSLRWAGIACLCLVLGLWRGQVVLDSFSPLKNHMGKQIELVAVIADDPGLTDRRQTEFHVSNLVLVNDSNRKVGGRLRVRGFANTKISRGDIVRIEGRLRTALGNRQGQISFAQIEVMGKNRTYIERIRRQFIAGTYTAIPEPGAGLGLGFLLGIRSVLPDTLTDSLSKTGLTHIVAVSGYNLTVIIRFVKRLLEKHSRYLAAVFSLGLVAGFVLMTGLSPSIMRATVVVSISIASWYYGHHIKPSVLLLVAAAVTAGLNPTYLWYDVGWYLSFLAFFGVLVIAPLLSRLFKTSSAFWMLCIETVSAQVMTIPLIMTIFGQVSIVSLPANLVVLPLIPIAMSLTFVSGLGGMLIASIAGWIAYPASFLLIGIVRVINWFGQLPGASMAIKLSLSQMVLIYIAIAIIATGLYRRFSSKIETYNIIA